MNADVKPPLLQYTVSTDPTPLNVSTSDDPVTAKILIAVKANPNVNCKRIQIVVNIGDASTDMYRKDPAPIIPSAPPLPPEWSPSTIIPPDVIHNTENTKVFTFTHTSEDKAVTKDVTFCISGIVNNISGVTTIQIYESSTLINDNSYMTRQQPEDITKAAEEAFFLKNIRAAYIGSPTAFITVFEKNKPIQLLWEGNADIYRVYSGTSSQPLMTSSNKYYNISGLEKDTTYIIEATKGDKTLYLQYIINIDEPKTTFSEITVFDKCDIRSSTIYSLGTIRRNIASRVAEADGFLLVDAVIAKTSLTAYGFITIKIYDKKYGLSIVGNPSWETPGSLTIPVKKGTPYIVEYGYFATPVYYNISFLPLGIPPATAIESEDHENNTDMNIINDTSLHVDKKRQKAAQFIGALEMAFEKELDEHVKNKLIESYLQ
ncbi:hypothetical protein [Chitinophaga sp. sic0106]|uniref:hypothetical protein n=1 Tax=Chitinophaga sp. sic0106 TaxID=2854785 RepID=UPI001C4425C5|nr:hypothetical protein [Chitinophaga sp. sic0106]MBV7530481.1 hypothetical protein [Chitinophaga sp. sic0106]